MLPGYDMVSDLERVRGRLDAAPDRPLTPERAAEVSKTLARLDRWTGAMQAGEVRAGELLWLEHGPPE